MLEIMMKLSLVFVPILLCTYSGYIVLSKPLTLSLKCVICTVSQICRTVSISKMLKRRDSILLLLGLICISIMEETFVPFHGIKNDFQNRLLCYKQDWTGGLRAGIRQVGTLVFV